MCRHATEQLPPQPRSVPAARSFLRQQVAAWQLDVLLPDAQLALSELVSNAVMHARTPLHLAVSCADQVLEVAVADASPLQPMPRPHRSDPASDIERAAALVRGRPGPVDDRDPDLHVGEAGSVAGGRGLLVVAALAESWGVSPRRDGKAVWFRMPVPDGWPHGLGCPCSTAVESQALASGRPVVHRVPAEPDGLAPRLA